MAIRPCRSLYVPEITLRLRKGVHILTLHYPRTARSGQLVLF
jgi:hypothetical protein